MTNVQLSHDTALKLAKQVVTTLDPKPLRPFIDAMMDDGFKDAVAFSAVSGDEPSDFNLFMAMCRANGHLSKEEAYQLSDALVDASRSQAA